MSKALEQLRADNEQLLQRLSESSALHEEKVRELWRMPWEEDDERAGDEEAGDS